MNEEFTIKDYYLFLLFLFLSILTVTSGEGADYAHYLVWSKYFSTFDLEVFSEYPKSKNGLPLVAWYYGPGLFTSILKKIFFFESLSIQKTVSILLTIINIALLHKICKNYKISGFSILLLFSIAYLFLPAGFYLNKYSSETWTIFLTLFSIFLIEYDINNFKDFKIKNHLLFGIILYFLILLKITNIFLALTILSIFLIKKIGKNKITKDNFGMLSKILFFGLFFIILATLFILTYHKLLNGSFLASPYNYSNNEFYSFSITNFKITEVIFSTWHGLLFYHPFYLFSFFFLLTISFKKSFLNRDSKLIILVVSILFFIQIILQSSHATWWMGVGTYGARGFAGISILTLYIILNIKNNLISIKLNNLIKIFTVLLLIHQTYILSLGESNFYNLSNFLLFFFSKESLILLTLIGSLVMVIIILKKIYNYNFYDFLKIAMISMTFFASVNILIAHKKAFFLLCLAILFSYFFANSIQIYTNQIKKISKNIIYNISSFIFALFFIFSIYAQIILFHQYYENTKPNFISGKNFDCREAVGSYIEYNYLPGYIDEKKIWLAFLKETGCL